MIRHTPRTTATSLPARRKPRVAKQRWTRDGVWVVYYTPWHSGKACRASFATWDEAIGYAIGRCQ